MQNLTGAASLYRLSSKEHDSGGIRSESSTWYLNDGIHRFWSIFVNVNDTYYTTQVKITYKIRSAANAKTGTKYSDNKCTCYTYSRIWTKSLTNQRRRSTPWALHLPPLRPHFSFHENAQLSIESCDVLWRHCRQLVISCKIKWTLPQYISIKVNSYGSLNPPIFLFFMVKSIVIAVLGTVHNSYLNVISKTVSRLSWLMTLIRPILRLAHTN